MRPAPSAAPEPFRELSDNFSRLKLFVFDEVIGHNAHERNLFVHDRPQDPDPG